MSPLALAIISPVVGAVLTPMVTRLSRRLGLSLALTSAALSVALLVVAAPDAYRGRVRVETLGGSPIGIALSGDALGLTAALVAAVVGAIALLATLSDLSDLGHRELGGYASLSLLLIAACVAGSLTADLLNLFVWFEVAALASYALTGFFLERPPAVEAALKIAVLTSIAGFLTFLGMAMLYQSHGVVNMAALEHALRHATRLDSVAIGLLLAGFGTKAGLVPFHGWLPDAHTAAPGPISALFSGVMVNFGIVAIARVGYCVAPPAHLPVSGVLMFIGMVSALFGAVFALVQDDLKRLLAYDTISQMGIIIVGLATASAAGAAGSTYHLVSHALFKALLFLIAGAIVHATGATTLTDVAGLARRSPWLTGLFILGSLAIAGVPPFNGYVSLGLIHDALMSSHQYAGLTAVLIAQIVTVAALGRVIAAFFRRTGTDFDRDEKVRPGLSVALWSLATACVVTGIPGLLLDHVVDPAAAVLSSPGQWSAAVLRGSGHITQINTPFEYAKPSELITTAACLALGFALMRAAQPHADSLRKHLAVIASGSVNDYAAYVSVGLVAVVAALLA